MMFAIVLALTVVGEPAAPEFEYSRFNEKGDTIASKVEKERVVFTVSSTRGIGSATIALKSGDWPKEIVILMTYSDGEGFKNLESIRLSTARVQATGGLGSSGKVPFAFVDADGETDPLEDGGTGGTLDIKVVKTDKGVELRLPPRLLVGSKSLRLFWVDAFRR